MNGRAISERRGGTEKKRKEKENLIHFTSLSSLPPLSTTRSERYSRTGERGPLMHTATAANRSGESIVRHWLRMFWTRRLRSNEIKHGTMYRALTSPCTLHPDSTESESLDPQKTVYVTGRVPFSLSRSALSFFLSLSLSPLYQERRKKTWKGSKKREEEREGKRTFLTFAASFIGQRIFQLPAQAMSSLNGREQP